MIYTPMKHMYHYGTTTTLSIAHRRVMHIHSHRQYIIFPLVYIQSEREKSQDTILSPLEENLWEQ